MHDLEQMLFSTIKEENPTKSLNSVDIDLFSDMVKISELYNQEDTYVKERSYTFFFKDGRVFEIISNDVAGNYYLEQFQEIVDSFYVGPVRMAEEPEKSGIDYFDEVVQSFEVFVFGLVFLIIGLPIIIVVIVRRVRKRRRNITESSGGQKQVLQQRKVGKNSSLDILKKRLAKGEISKEEFDNIKKDLT